MSPRSLTLSFAFFLFFAWGCSLEPEITAGAPSELVTSVVCIDSKKSQRFGMNLDAPNPGGNPAPSDLKAAGVRWVRMEWKKAWGADPYAAYGAVFDRLRSEGIRVLLVVGQPATGLWAPDINAPEAEWGNFLRAYAEQLENLARYYGNRVDAWQIWNEPDLDDPAHQFDTPVPATVYGQMLRDAVERIRLRGHSTRPIITGGMASGNPAYVRQALPLREDGTLPVPIDAIAVHPYGQRAPDGWPYPTWGFGDMSQLLQAYLSLSSLPVWITESGIHDPKTTEDGTVIEVQYIENVYRLVEERYADRIPHVFWYGWSDLMTDGWGLLAKDGTPKDNYRRYQATAPAWGPECAGDNDVVVYAAGTAVAGVYPVMELYIDNQRVATFADVRGDANARQFQRFVYTHSYPVLARQVKVRFTNDLYAPPADRNLRVDAIELRGVRYEAEADVTYSTGTWASADGCAPGFKRSEWLHCPGYLDFSGH